MGCVLQVDRHLRKLDQELAKFKMELEADNAGITEILERRESLSITTPTLSITTPQKPHPLHLNSLGPVRMLG